MTDLARALQRALYDRLQATVTLGEVWQHPPQDVAPDLVMINTLTAANLGSKDGEEFDRFDIDIASLARAPGMLPVSAMQAEIRRGLNQFTPPLAGQVAAPAGAGVLDSGGFGRAVFSGDFDLSFRVPQSGTSGLQELQVGLDAAPGAFGYEQIDHCFFLFRLTSTPTWRVYRNLVQSGVTTGFTGSDFTFGIRRTGLQIAYLIDGVIVHSYAVTSVEALGIVVACEHRGQEISDIVVRENGRRALLEMTGHGGAVATTGLDCAISALTHRGCSAQLLEDGITYLGSSRFSTFVQPAD